MVGSVKYNWLYGFKNSDCGLPLGIYPVPYLPTNFSISRATFSTWSPTFPTVLFITSPAPGKAIAVATAFTISLADPVRALVISPPLDINDRNLDNIVLALIRISINSIRGIPSWLVFSYCFLFSE